MTSQPLAPQAGLPGWARTIAEAYAGGASQMFVLHGNVGDLIRAERPEGISYAMLPEVLAAQVFGQFDAVIYYDQVRGPRALAGSLARLTRMNQHVERYIGKVEELRDVRDVARVLALLDRYLELALLREDERPSIAVILDYAHLIAPAGAAGSGARDQAAALPTLLNWARSPYFKKAAFAFCLVSERLSDLAEPLAASAHTTRVEVPFPDRDERLRFIDWTAAGRDFAALSEFSAEELAALTAGLTLVHLQGLVQRSIRTGARVSARELKAYKKQMIEGQCQGLVEFVEPDHTLELVVGQEAAKRRLLEDAELLRKGRLDAVPMGYLFCGPVGTGKTFLAECYAGSVGIPCVKLLNFRSKYVGETEGNLEKILKVLRVIGPVAVIIDEADAMLGDRRSGGDSGTSSRVFGQFAAQMGNTEYRGRIVWFLLTCRPDLLPIDLKRQGRCEVHIPLFYPETEAEVAAMFVSMGKKNRIDVDPSEVPAVPAGLALSGADIEGIVTRAKRLALVAGREGVDEEHLAAALADFLPSHESAEKELQRLAAVVECTELAFLPASLRAEAAAPAGRAALARRFEALKRSLVE